MDTDESAGSPPCEPRPQDLGPVSSDARENEELQGDTQAGPNLLAHSVGVMVEVPENIEIKLVNAAFMMDYEGRMLESSILLSLATGFLVAFFQDPDVLALLATALIFCAMFSYTIRRAVAKRNEMLGKAKTVHFTATATDPSAGPSRHSPGAPR